MISNLAYYSILGFPLVAHIGVITILLVLITSAIGSLHLKGKIKTSVKVHIYLAWIAIFFALIHAILALSIYFNF